MSTTKMGLTIEEAAECTGIGRNTKMCIRDRVIGVSAAAFPQSLCVPAIPHASADAFTKSSRVVLLKENL